MKEQHNATQTRGLGIWFTRPLNWGINGTVFLSMVALSFMTITVTADVVLRYVFNVPTNWIGEIATFLQAMIVMLCLAYAQKAKAHIRVNLLLPRWPEKIQQWVLLIIYVVSFAFAVILTYLTGKEFMLSVKFKSVSESVNAFPLAPWQALLPIGLALFALVLIWDIVNQIVKIKRGEPRAQEEVETTSEPF